MQNESYWTPDKKKQILEALRLNAEDPKKYRGFLSRVVKGMLWSKWIEEKNVNDRYFFQPAHLTDLLKETDLESNVTAQKIVRSVCRTAVGFQKLYRGKSIEELEKKFCFFTREEESELLEALKANVEHPEENKGLFRKRLLDTLSNKDGEGFAHGHVIRLLKKLNLERDETAETIVRSAYAEAMFKLQMQKLKKLGEISENKVSSQAENGIPDFTAATPVTAWCRSGRLERS